MHNVAYLLDYNVEKGFQLIQFCAALNKLSLVLTCIWSDMNENLLRFNIKILSLFSTS